MRRMRNWLASVAFVAPVLSLTAAYAQDVSNPAAPYVPKACSTHVTVAPADVADDPNLDPAVRKFLIPLDKDPSPFWEQPQPKPQQVVTDLQNQTRSTCPA